MDLEKLKWKMHAGDDENESDYQIGAFRMVIMGSNSTNSSFEQVGTGLYLIWVTQIRSKNQ